MLRQAQQVIQLRDDEDDFDLDGPISRDKENDPLEMLIMGYRQYYSSMSSGDHGEEYLLGYTSKLWRQSCLINFECV